MTDVQDCPDPDDSGLVFNLKKIGTEIKYLFIVVKYK